MTGLGHTVGRGTTHGQIGSPKPVLGHHTSGGGADSICYGHPFSCLGPFVEGGVLLHSSFSHDFEQAIPETLIQLRAGKQRESTHH